jgi:DNA repair photolyase
MIVRQIECKSVLSCVRIVVDRALEEAVQRVLEPHAWPIEERLTALHRLHDAGIRTWAVLDPVLPAFSDSEDAIDKMFATLAETAVSYILVDALNVRNAQRGRLCRILQSHYPEQVESCCLIQHDRRGYAQALASRVARAAERHNVSYKLAF